VYRRSQNQTDGKCRGQTWLAAMVDTPAHKNHNVFPKKIQNTVLVSKNGLVYVHKLTQNIPNVEIFHQGLGSFLFYYMYTFFVSFKALTFYNKNSENLAKYIARIDCKKS
jgi:exosome complex RNA-binding protein Rrp4